MTAASIRKMSKAALVRECNDAGLPVCRDMTKADLADLLISRMEECDRREQEMIERFTAWNQGK